MACASGAATRSRSSASRRCRGRSCASTARTWARAAEVTTHAGGTPKVPRVLILVCDSFGVGGAPDAQAYGDAGSDTLGNTAAAVGGIHAPNLGALGLGMLTGIEGVEPRAETGSAHGRLTERSAGKDTTTGHWEMTGIVLAEPFPLYPDGFPPEIILA